MRASISALDLTAMHHKCMGDVLLRHVAPPFREAAARDAAIFCATCPALREKGQRLASAPVAVQAFLKKSLLPAVGVDTDLRKANASLQRLTQLREQEARRIGEALHREASQLLASVHLALADFAQGLDAGQRGGLEHIRELLDKIEGELRRISHELCPPILDSRGLISALDELARGVAARARIPVAIQGHLKERLPAFVEVTIYRIVQEAVNNAVKHARPRHIWVDVLREKRELTCTVRDDGTGFDVRRLGRRSGKRGLGVIGIEDRVNALGGKLSFSSAAGAGTSVLVNIPLGSELLGSGEDTEDRGARATTEDRAGGRSSNGSGGAESSA